MSDAQLYAIVTGAIGMGAAAVKLAQMALRRNNNHSKKPNGSDHSKIAVLESEILTVKDEIAKLRERVHDLANRIQILVTTEELRKRQKE